ncbi:hypothetical protein GH5_06812 [Leishmania sp. Ghana 2012 LV757]|uniref:hypothetical protein n=1 Tax=Leishmania sp. Ghana 2012 LV757 TaxID=2803181 RepID=UPI001B6A1696|nr:hypothetical protein GH5_06812 [Leishmania sp. Ghana 2012 LV757]
MPSRLAYITTHFFSLPSVQDESMYATTRPAQELTSSTALAAGAAPAHRSTGGPLDGSRLMMAARRGGGAGGGSQLHAAAATGRPSSLGSSAVLTPLLPPASPTSPMTSRWSTFSVSPSNSSGGLRSLAALTRARRAHEDSNLGSPSSPVLPGAGIGADAFGTEATLPSLPTWSAEARPWLVSAGAGVAGREGAATGAAMVGSRHTSPRIRAAGRHGSQASAAGPMSPAARPPSSTRGGPAGPAAGHDHSSGGIPTGASGRDGDGIGGRGGLHTTFADPVTTLITEADSDLLVPPLLHFVEDEEALRYVAGLLNRRRLDEVASAVEAVEQTSAEDISLPPKGSNRAVVLQRDYVLSAQQGKLLHVLVRPISGAQSTMCNRRARASTPPSSSDTTGGAMRGAVVGDSAGISAQGRDHSRAPLQGLHLRASGDEEVAAIPMKPASTGSLATDLPPPPAAASDSSLYLTAVTRPLCDLSGDGECLSCTRSDDAAVSHQLTAQQLDGTPRGRLAANGPGDGASAAAAALRGAESGPEGHSADDAAADAAMASGRSPIDVEGFCLAVRHNVFANYRTLPLHCAQRSYEQLPVRYRAGLDAISAEVLQQQQRERQQGSTGAVSTADEAANGGAAACMCNGGTTSIRHPRCRCTDGPSAGISTATPGVAGYAAESYHDPITFIGMGYCGAGGLGGAWPTNASLPGSISATSTAATPAASPGWLRHGESMRPGASVFPSLPTRATEDASTAAMASSAPVSTNPTTRGAAAAAAGPPVSPLPSASPASAMTTTPANMYDPTAGTGLVCRAALLQHVQHTIQAFIARGEREVALHFIMATAPYRFSGTTDSDRVLAFFNQIRFFLPSPRFGIVLLTMEAWRSLYRPSVGAGAADCTHMTQELLALIETYLCHGRTYAEYVSGLLMLRAVLGLAMENSTLCSRTAAVLLQHRSLLGGRLPTFLLAVWLILMEFYTIEDTVLPPRRVLRDLAANAMQDLFTVALELHMLLPVQNLVANAVNVFFAGPQPQPQLSLSSPITTAPSGAAVSAEAGHRGGAEGNGSSLLSANHVEAAAAATNSLHSNSANTVGRSVGSDVKDFPLRTLEAHAAAAVGGGVPGGGAPGAGNAPGPSPPQPKLNPRKSTVVATANSAAAGVLPHRVPGADAASAAAVPFISLDPTESSPSVLRRGVATSASPAPQAPALSYRGVAKSLWGSVKRAAGRLVHLTSAPSRSRSLAPTAIVRHRRDSAEAAGTAHGAFSGALGGSFWPSAADFSACSAPAPPLSTNGHPSPPLLIEVLDDVFRESIDADSSKHAGAAARWTDSGPQQVPPSAASTAGGGRSLAQCISPPSSQVTSRAAATGGGRGTMPTQLYALRKPGAACSPVLRSGSWAQRRPQRRSFGTAAAAATTLGESSSAFSDALLGDIPLDDAVLSRDAIWTLPLAYALRGAGRPKTLEATVAASTLTLGAFLCAWRIAGFSDEANSDHVESQTSQQPSETTKTTAASVGDNPPEIIVPSSGAPLPRHLSPASGGAGSGDADPLTEGAVLPLLTPESLVAVAGSGVLAGRLEALGEPASLPCLPPPTGGSATMPHDAGATRGIAEVPTGELGKPLSMLSTTMAALATGTGVPRHRTRFLASITTDADPEWQSVERTATNVFMPPVAVAAPPITTASGAATRAAGDEVTAATPPLVTDTAPTPDPTAGLALNVTQSAAPTAAMGGSGCSGARWGCVSPPGASQAAATASPTPDPTFSQCISCTSGGMQGAASLAASVMKAGRQSGLPATTWTPTTESCGARVSSNVAADFSATDNSRSRVRARSHADTALLTLAPPAPTVPFGATDGRLNVAAVAAQTPCLEYFLPSWAAARVVERCVHPCWEVISPTAQSSPMGGAKAATRRMSTVPVTKEAEVLLTSVVPLLSQYYVNALSASAVTAATQLLVNRAILAVRFLSQGLRDGSRRCGISSGGGASAEAAAHPSPGTLPPSSSAPHEPDVTSHHSYMLDTSNGAKSPAASPRAAAPTDAAPATTPSTPYAPPFAAWQAEDSALVDGTELLNAILFMTTVAERYPAVYEIVMRQKLYPLLHHTLLLHTFAVEEPQLLLSAPLSSAAAAAHFNVDARAPAVQPLVPQHQQQQYSAPPVFPATAMEGEAVMQRMRLITARAMYQRLAMPALVLLSHNMPDDACARRCYPLVVRLAQLGLRRPFSMASVTTALCICAVYPPLSRVCQSELVRAMAVVLATPDDGLSDRGGDGADNTAATTASREAEAVGVRLPHRSRRGHAPTQPGEEQQGTRKEEAVRSKPAAPARGAVTSPTSLPTHAATAAASQGLLPRPSSRRAMSATAAAVAGSAIPSMWRSQLNLRLFFPFSSTHLGHLHLPAASVLAARRRQAAHARLIKHHCFRAMSLFYSSWEGTTLFFLEVCLPYLRHPDAQLRLECVQCCMRWLLSNCWHSTDQSLPHHHAAMPAVGAGGIAAASSTALTPACGSVTTAVTRAPVRDPRTTANAGSSTSGGVQRVTALPCLTTLSAPAAAQAGQVCIPYHAPPRQTAEGLCVGDSLGLGDGAAAVALVPTATTRAPAMRVYTVQHHGRTHVNALREVVHHLVEMAVCDPEPLIRRCALDSLSPETYPLLYPHEPFVHQLFTVLWDSHMPNRSKAAQVLCALAPLNPSSIFPRLRQVLAIYTDDLTSSIARLAAPVAGANSDRATLPIAPPEHIHEDALFVLSLVASRLNESAHLYLPQLLSIVSSVLRSASSPRGSVLRALHLLVALREDSTEEQSALFAPFFDIVAQQLIDGDGDTARLLATVAALQSLLQQFTGWVDASSQTLPVVVECLHSLLYRKPSVVTEFAMAVLQLLGTISTIEPWDSEAAPRAPALLRRPKNRYALPPLSSSAGVLGRGRAVHSRWLDRDERADSAADALGQLQKADRFSPFTARAWCDTVLRALMRTVSGYVNGTMSQTQGGLCTCLAAIMNILTNTVAIHHLEVYMPTVLTLVIDLLEKRQTRSRKIETVHGLAAAHKLHSSTTSTAAGRGEGASTVGGPTEAAKISDSSEAIRQLFLRSLFDLVLVAGRRIGPMYPLLNVFLRRSWKTMPPRGLVQCCEVLDALCWAVPDLLRDDCDVWVSSLLEALIEYDALVVTHRRAHEAAPGSATAAVDVSTGAAAGSTVAGAAARSARGGANAGEAHASTLPSFAAPRRPVIPVGCGSFTDDTNDSRRSPMNKPHTPPSTLQYAVAADGDDEAPWEQQLKLVYQALTLCLTSLQPLLTPLAKRLVALSLSECLKSSYVPRDEAARRSFAPTATALPTDSRTEKDCGPDAEQSAMLATSTLSSLRSFRPSAGNVAAAASPAVFDLMADPHEELISFLNACVCTPLLECMLHSNLSTASMKLVKNLLSRLESLSAVHEEALQRLWGAMSRRSVSLLPQSASSSGLSWRPDLASGTATWPEGGACSLTAPARAQLEVKLREVREQLHVQRAREYEESSGPANVSGCGAGAFPSRAAFYAAPRSASEALWFQRAALSRMWVQSTDRAVTVRRYFPFDAVQTSWETEGEMQLLGCLLVSVAWHHPPSTTAFAATLHTYFEQRFGPDSVAVAYVRCICSSYYDLRMPLVPAHDEEVAVKWSMQQQRQQRVAATGSVSDTSSESGASLITATRSALTSGPGLYDAAGQITREGSADVILRHLSSPPSQTAAIATPWGKSTVASTRGGAVLLGSSGMGSRVVSWEEETLALAVSGGQGASVPCSAAAVTFAGVSWTREATPGAQSNTAATSLGSVLTATATVCGPGAGDFIFAHSTTAYPSMDRLDGSSDAHRLAEMGATKPSMDDDEVQDGSGRMRADARWAYLARNSNDSAVPHRSQISYQQQQYQLLTGAAASTPFYGSGSLPRTITAYSTNGAETLLSTTHDHSSTTATLPIPVEVGGGGGGVHGVGSLDNYADAAVPVGVSGIRSESGSVSSFYPGSFFTSAAVAEGRVGVDGDRRSGAMNSSPHRHHIHTSLCAGGGGSPADRESIYARGSSEAAPPTPARVGSGAGVNHTAPICRPFQLLDPQPFPAGQPHYPYPLSSGTLPSVTLGQQPAASPSVGTGMRTVGSFNAASLGHRRGLLGLTPSIFSPAGGTGGGASGAAGGPGGIPPRWRFASIAASVSADDRASPNSFAIPLSAGGGASGALLPSGVASHDAATAQQQARRRLSPLLTHSCWQHYPSCGAAVAVAGAAWSHSGTGDEFSGPQLQPPSGQQAQRHNTPSPLFFEVSATSAAAVTAAASAVRSTTTTTTQPVPLSAEACCATAPGHSSSATMCVVHDGRMSPSAEAASEGAWKEAAASVCVAREMLEACAAAAAAHEAGEVEHHNSLIAYFELHRSLSGHGWRSWWVQFCLYLLQCSPDYCIQACEPFARQHHIAFSYSELLPLALLSTLPSCTVAELVAWLRALRDFYAFHTDPRAPVPQQVASGVARMAHDLRLYRHTFFPPEVVSRVVDVWLPDNVVAELANRSLNPPLRILYLEQDLTRSFSWGCTALLMAAADDVASAMERTLFVQDSRFQRWISSVAATQSETRSRGTAAAEATKSSSAIDVLSPSALELLGFHRAAALEYVRAYVEHQMSEGRDGRRGAAAEGCEATQHRSAFAPGGTMTRRHLSATASEWIVGAMRCRICLCDFEAVLHLWDAFKGRGGVETITPMTGSSSSVADCGKASDGDSGSAVVLEGARRLNSCALSPETARYVVMSAQALSRWDYVQEAAYYAFGCGSGGGLAWTTGAQQGVQGHTHKSGGSAAPSAVTPHDWRPLEPPGNPQCWVEDVKEEGCSQRFPSDAFSVGTVALREADYTRESLLQRQMEVFVGAALVASHDYDGARRALTAVRNGLRDSYAVFHTDNDRVKLEWSSIFQQLSDLEEGMRALEEVPAVQEGMAALPTGSESGGISAGRPGSGSPALDREINGKLFPEVTVRRLRNIACRPVSATTTILQRFMIIAARSAIAPVTWQLDNVLALGEKLDKVGQPMRAVQVLHHYANLPVVAASFTTVAMEFKQQLNLEMLRRLIRNLSREEDLREVYACVQTVLRHDLWLARRAATRRMTSISSASSFMASSGAAAELMSSPLRNQPAMDGAAPCGIMLTVPELGPSLSHYQVDLLVLSVACRRRLTHVLRHRAPLARRSSPATPVSGTSDTSAPLTAASASHAALSSTPETVRQLTGAPALPIGVERSPRLSEADAAEEVKALDAELHSPASSTTLHPLSGLPASAAPPSSARRGAASGAAAARRAGDGASCPHNSAKSQCTGRSGTSPAREGSFKSDETATAAMEEAMEKEIDSLSLETLTGKTAMFAEYYLLEHVVAVTNYVPSVWREFGLVLFDICMAIHAEWRLTEDEETKQNFLTQSAKAIHGLQLAAQLWRSRSESVFSRGIGPFPATTLRRHGHARTALPSAHLLLKALHLAVTCDAIVQDGARAAAASATAAAPVASAAAAPSGLSSLPQPASTPASRSSWSGGSEVTKDAAAGEAPIGPEGGCCTLIPVTTPQSLPVSQSTEQLHAHTCDAETMEETEAEIDRGSKANKNDASTPARPSSHSTSQPQPTASAAVTQQQGGFACLDFSAASYVQWAAVAPFLLAAAARHRSLYTAVRDMCVQSRDMLRQLVFPLIATFEHEYGTLFAQQASHLRCHRVIPGEETPSTAAAAETVSRQLTTSFTALASEGQEGGRQPQGRRLSASTSVSGGEYGSERANRIGCSTSAKTPSPLGQQGEAASDATGAGLIAKRAASASAMEAADRRYMGRRRVANTALATPLLRTRSGISDGEATPLAGAAAHGAALGQHLVLPPLGRPLEEAERKVHSSLLADVAAASPAHRRLIQEAMLIRDFARGLWEVPAASPQKPKPVGPAMRPGGTDAAATPLGAGEGAPPSTQRTHEEAAGGATAHGATSDRGAASGFLAIGDADGRHGEMELLLDGCCPLPAPLWLLPSVFGVGLAAGDSGVSCGCCAHGNTGGDEGVRAVNVHSGGVGTGPDAAARSRPHGGPSGGSTSPDAAATISRMAGHHSARADDDSGRVTGLPLPCGTDLSTSAATAYGQRAAHSTAASAVGFAPATVPTILHARRYAVPHPAPHHQCEEVIFVMLSDGLVCRFRHAAPDTSTKAGEVFDDCDAPHGATESLITRLGSLRKSTAASADAGARDTLTCEHTAADRYVLPYALMEQIASLLLSHLPLTHLQRPFVLPLAVQDYMTMLPEHGTSPLILGAATAAAVRSDDSQEWRQGMELLTGASSGNSAAALRTATQLLARSSDATCTPPSLYHLMDDYTVHLRVREMALAAQEAVEAYPALDLDAIQIAAETGRRCGVSADNSYPFNWAFGYPVSAPPSHEAAGALRDSQKYRNLVHRRRMNEERFNQLVAAAYDDGCVGPLIAFLQGLLAARPPPPPSWSSSPPSAPAAHAGAAAFGTSTSTAATTSSFSASTLAPAPQPFRPAEETFLLQQRIYAYAAVLPRTEAHLRRVLEAVAAAAAGGEDNWAKESSTPSSSSSPLSPAAAPVLNTKRRDHSHRAACPKAHLTSASTLELRACRLALFRLESARFRLALNDAFTADSGNASHWLEARRTYAKELSEWSVMQYLLDVHTRECGTVLVNTYDGHVAVHALGRYCLQPPPRHSRGACAKDTATYAGNAAPLIMSPFPTHDATLFRFTPVMVAGLPLQSPHTAFQYHASSVLYEIFQYVRDLTGISTYGVDCVTAFAHTASAPNAAPSPSSHTSSIGTPLSMWTSADFSGTTSGNCGAAVPGLQATLRPEDNPARGWGLASADVPTEGAALLSSAAAPRHASAKVAVAPKRRQRDIPPPLEPLVGAPAAAAFTFSSFGASPARGAAQRHLALLFKDAAVPAALPPPPHCFDSSSIRSKLTYDALLVLHGEAERSGRAAILRLLRSQRKATEAQWLHMPPASPPEDGAEGNTAKAEVPAANHSAAEDQAGETPAPPAFARGDSNDDDDNGAPRWASAIDLVASMITAATSEEHLLGVDGVYPHLWQRWAPHW